MASSYLADLGPVVPIHLISTGSNPLEDDLLNISAVILDATRSRFQQWICPGGSVSSAYIGLNRPREDSLRHARPLHEVIAAFLRFLPKDALLLSHRFQVDSAYLYAMAGDVLKDRILDTQLLARIVFPCLPSHDLWVLQDFLGLGEPEEQTDPCDVVGELWNALGQQILHIPGPAFRVMHRLAMTSSATCLAKLLGYLAKEICEPGDETWLAFDSLIHAGRSMDTELQEIPSASRVMSSPKEIASLLGQEGPFASKLEGYEEREAQMIMAQSVAEAFLEEKHLMVEAGTGVGKSLGYLVPSVLWSLSKGHPVVISTNTKNLQAQLFYKDLPLIQETLGLPFRSALLKGRANYLCLRKFHYVAMEFDQELDAAERLAFLSLFPWVVNTDSGDLSECGATGHVSFQSLHAKLTTLSEECLGKKCGQFKRCFVGRARDKAMGADIVVANHALVFAEMNMRTSALPAYEHIVFDEAHNLEDAATNHLSLEVSTHSIYFPLRRLRRPSSRGIGTGLLPSILHQCESLEYRGHQEVRDQIYRFVRETMDAVSDVDVYIGPFFRALSGLLHGDLPRDSLRIRWDKKEADSWVVVHAAQGELISALARIVRGCEALSEAMLPLEEGEMPYLLEFEKDLEGTLLAVRGLMETIGFVLDCRDEEYVFWVERVSRKKGGMMAQAAPISVGALLCDRLYKRLKTVIFSSATLSVRGSFDFLRKRLGMDGVEENRILELNAGTPFDYMRQCVILVPMFLPEPGDTERDYAEELGHLISDVFFRTRGRGMVLFTSYDMLKRSTEVFSRDSKAEGMRILIQGVSGSREGITTLFRRDIHSVLMGTHSFWEGVDIVGESLSCLIMARLPFAVYTDPVIQARCERVEANGQDSFTGYSLPMAVIRFRQGFGRLIRHRNDRGVVIVADKRISTRRYGGWFRSSLPASLLVYPQRKPFLDALSRFMDGENGIEDPLDTEYDDLGIQPW